VEISSVRFGPERVAELADRERRTSREGFSRRRRVAADLCAVIWCLGLGPCFFCISGGGGLLRASSSSPLSLGPLFDLTEHSLQRIKPEGRSYLLRKARASFVRCLQRAERETSRTEWRFSALLRASSSSPLSLGPLFDLTEHSLQRIKPEGKSVRSVRYLERYEEANE
jgi:hypothetical protein